MAFFFVYKFVNVISYGFRLKEEMEALKSSFRPQLVVVNNNVISDDLWGNNGQTGDDFFVDNLLDFSKACPDEDEEDQQNEDRTILPLPQPDNYKSEPSSTNTLSLNHASGSVPDSELCVPVKFKKINLLCFSL